MTTDFDLFWQAYPLRVGKKAAKRAWEKAKDRPSIDVIFQALLRAEKSKRWKEGYIPNPATWINQGRWDDELPPAETAPQPKALRLVERRPVAQQTFTPPPAEVMAVLNRIGKRM